MITPKRTSKSVQCGKCQKHVMPRNGEADLRMVREGTADYFCEECANTVSSSDGDICLMCKYEFVQDEIRYTFQMHSTVNVKTLYKKEELCAAGNICERCRKLVEKVVSLHK
jgi:hypothetical protein